MNEELTLVDLGDATVETREKPGPKEDSIGEPALFVAD
jgi:hypothetical protein